MTQRRRSRGEIIAVEYPLCGYRWVRIFSRSVRKAAQAGGRCDKLTKASSTRQRRKCQVQIFSRSVRKAAQAGGRSDKIDPTPPISERQQPLVFIEFQTLEKPDFSLEFVEKYRNGFSVSEIAKLYGTSKRKVTAALNRNRVNMRPARTLSTVEALRNKATGGCKPYYGFCYFEGRLTKHPIEFPILLTIHRHWQKGLSAHYINLEFAKTKVKSRAGRKWCWGSIQNILKRFEEKKVVLHKGGHYELR